MKPKKRARLKGLAQRFRLPKPSRRVLGAFLGAAFCALGAGPCGPSLINPNSSSSSPNSSGGGSGTIGTTSTPAFSTFQRANIVIGQPDFTSLSLLAAADNTLGTQPFGIPTLLSNGFFYIPNLNFNRILVFNGGIPTSNFPSASSVIGQTDFVTTTVGATNEFFYRLPNHIIEYQSKMYLAERGNHRVTIWNSLPTSFSQANIVLGQADMTSGTTTCDAIHMNAPRALMVTGGKLFVVDAGHHRVMVWNTIPTIDGTPADYAIGQPDLTTCNAGTTQILINNPRGIWSDGTKLYLVESGNQRVSIWNTIPTASNTPMDSVFGQADFTSGSANRGGSVGALTLNLPYWIASDGTQFFLSDTDNSRVLFWNHVPTGNETPAGVLGQADFTHRTENDDNQDNAEDSQASDRVFQRAGGLYYDSQKLIVGDAENRRYLIFNRQ